MAFDRPTLSEIIDRIKSDLESAFNFGSPALRRSGIGLFAKAFGGAVHMLHGHLEFLSKQILVDTATTEYLERYAGIWGLTRKPSDFAAGNVTFTGTNGAVISAGTLLNRSDGIQYELDAEVTIASGTGTGSVICLTTGSTGNTDSAVVLTLGSPISGVDSSVTVAIGGLTGGVGAETDDSLRSRVLARIQEPPKGGAASDYEQWATSIEGVTRAFVFPLALGPGTISVYIVNDNAEDPIPPSAKVAEVQAYIDDVRPVTATPTVLAPVAIAMNPSIQISPNTSAVRAAIAEELKALLRREGSVGGEIIRSHISEAISGAAGETDHVLVSPSGNFVLGSGEFPVLGTVTFSTIP